MRIFLIIWTGLLLGCASSQKNKKGVNVYSAAEKILHQQIIDRAKIWLQAPPETVTTHRALRSAGGPHDFYSEGDYWWPNPISVDSPYIQKDGLSNPDNFVAHRQAMIRLSKMVGLMGSAFKITGDPKYVHQALLHCKAWFVDSATRMNPNMLYAQAIKGRVTGRGIGIIDAIHFMEVVQGLSVMESAPAMDQEILLATKKWFSQFIDWLTTHPYGIAEMNAANNHGTCWVMQVASFARFTGNEHWMRFCRSRFKEVLLPQQMALDGSFPREMARTKPYGYALFNLDAMATICQILSTPSESLWTFSLADGRSIQKGIQFMAPYIAQKNTWPFAKDVMYWDQWPVAHPLLIFGAAAYDKQDWFHAWIKLEHFPQVEEVVRNLPIKNPLIWMTK